MPVLTTTEKIAYDDIVVEAIRRESLESKDYILNLPYDGNLGSRLSRVEIEAVIMDNTLPLPTNTVSFRIIDSSGNVFIVTYLDMVDSYIFEKMTIAS